MEATLAVAGESDELAVGGELGVAVDGIPGQQLGPSTRSGYRPDVAAPGDGVGRGVGRECRLIGQPDRLSSLAEGHGVRRAGRREHDQSESIQGSSPCQVSKIAVLRTIGADQMSRLKEVFGERNLGGGKDVGTKRRRSRPEYWSLE
jgi:hypothetical protein